MAEGGHIYYQTEKFVGERDSNIPKRSEEKESLDSADNTRTRPGLADNVNDEECGETPITESRSGRKKHDIETLRYYIQEHSEAGVDSSENPSGEDIQGRERNQVDDPVPNSNVIIDKHDDDGISNNRTGDNIGCDPGASNLVVQENTGGKDNNRVEVLPKSSADAPDVVVPKVLSPVEQVKDKDPQLTAKTQPNLAPPDVESSVYTCRDSTSKYPGSLSVLPVGVQGEKFAQSSSEYRERYQSCNDNASNKTMLLQNSNTLPMVPPDSKHVALVTRGPADKNSYDAHKEAGPSNACGDTNTNRAALLATDPSSTPAPDDSQPSVEGGGVDHNATDQVATPLTKENEDLGQTGGDVPPTETQAQGPAALSPITTGFPELPGDGGRGDDSGVHSADSNSGSSSSPVSPCPPAGDTALCSNPASPQLTSGTTVCTNPASPQLTSGTTVCTNSASPQLTSGTTVFTNPTSGPTGRDAQQPVPESGGDVLQALVSLQGQWLQAAEEWELTRPRSEPQDMSLALPQWVLSSLYALCYLRQLGFTWAEGLRVVFPPRPANGGVLPTPSGSVGERPVTSYAVHDDLNVSDVPLDLLIGGAVGGPIVSAVNFSDIITTSAATSTTSVGSSDIIMTSAAASTSTPVGYSDITTSAATSLTAVRSHGIMTSSATSLTAVRSCGIITTSAATSTTTTVTTVVASSSSSTYRSSFVTLSEIGIRHSPRIALIPLSRQPAAVLASPVQRHRPPIFVPSLGPMVLLRRRFDVVEEEAAADALSVTVSLPDGQVLLDSTDLTPTEGTEGPQEFTVADDLQIVGESNDETQESANTGRDREIAANELVAFLNVPRHELMGQMMRRLGWTEDASRDRFCQVCRRRRVNVITFQCHHTVLCHLCVRTCHLCPAQNCQHRHIEFFYRFDVTDADSDDSDD